MQQGNEFIIGGTDCCKTNSGKHIIDDHCRYCGQTNVVKQEVERLRAENEQLSRVSLERVADATIHLRDALMDAKQQLAACRAECERLRLEIAISDRRLLAAAVRVGLIFGCDSAEHMADEIEQLREQLAACRPALRFICDSAVIPADDAESHYRVLLTKEWLERAKEACDEC